MKEVTTENLEECTPLEIIDFVEAKLTEQGCQSKNEKGECLYRGPNNTKCGIGHIISDEKYREDMEGRDIIGLIIKDLFPETKHKSLLRDIQMIHDSEPASDWPIYFSRLRKTYLDCYKD